MPIHGDTPQRQGHRVRERAAIVEAIDIPILSATDRLQRALLRWVDLCGISGLFHVVGDVQQCLAKLDLLDDHAYIIGIIGEDPSEWPILWSGEAVLIDTGREFGPSIRERTEEPRLVSLLAQEYSDAVRYRRAAARRFCMRRPNADDAVDQLIFPIRDRSSFDYVLVRGESVSGEFLYDRNRTVQDREVQ